MPDLLFEFFLLFMSVFFSAFYSGAEAVIVSISPDRVRQLISEGGSKGKSLEFLSSHSNTLLSTILFGNTLVNIFAGSYSARLAEKYFHNDLLGVSVGITTIVILLFGEAMPKVFARKHADILVVPVIRFLMVNYYFFYPIIKSITGFIHLVLGKNAELTGRLVTIDDIEFMVNKAEQEKTMDSKQLDLLSSILEFPTIKVRDIMVIRTKINYLTKKMNYFEALRTIRDNHHSRYPVCDDDLEHTIGLLHVKDLVFFKAHNIKNFDITRYLKPPFFVYEHMKIQAVFDHMNRKKVHLALVKNENGLVVGMVTLEDIMEEIFGEIHDEHDQEEDKDGIIQEKKEHEGLIVDGSISLRDLYNDFDIKIPLNDNYSTLNGFLLETIGNQFPKRGMIIFWEGYSFKIRKVESNEIKEVRITDVDGTKHLYSKRSEEPSTSSENNSSSKSQGDT